MRTLWSDKEPIKIVLFSQGPTPKVCRLCSTTLYPYYETNFVNFLHPSLFKAEIPPLNRREQCIVISYDETGSIIALEDIIISQYLFPDGNFSFKKGDNISLSGHSFIEYDLAKLYSLEDNAFIASKPVIQNGGIYNVQFSPADYQNKEGNFLVLYENSYTGQLCAVDYISVVKIGAFLEIPSSADKCVIYGVLLKSDGTPLADATVLVRVIKLPQEWRHCFIAGVVLSYITDENGKFEFEVLRGATVQIQCDVAGISHEIEVPDVSEINLVELL